MKNLSKAIALCTLSIIMSIGANAQIKRGDFYFKKFEYGLALEAYQFAYEEQRVMNPYVLRRLALTHRKLGNMEESYEWYKKTIHREQKNFPDFLYYAESLKYMKKYKEAMKFYKKYAKKVPTDRRAALHLENLDYVEELHRDSVFYKIKRLGMNTSNPEFGLTKYKDGYLFSAVGVINPELGKGSFSKEEASHMYLDVYRASRDAEDELHIESPLGETINSEFHDGPVTYDVKNEELIVTRTNMSKGEPVIDSKGSVNLKLYTAQHVNGQFSATVELPFNSDEFSNAHPSVTPDGKKLYFASNRDGGSGESDLWVSERQGDSWGHPQNLGTVINTEGDENWPYFSEDGWLYFASTGHAGLGGSDIFRTKFIDGLWSKPENLGAPINSNKDDFGIVTEDEGNKGYFSSNRHSHTVDDDLYRFAYDPNIIIRGKVRDENSLVALDGALAQIFDMDGNLIAETKTNVDGAFDFKMIPKKCRYFVEISNGKDYSAETREIVHCDERLKLYDLGTIKLGEMRYLARGYIRDAETDKPVPNFITTLYNATTGDKINMKLTKNDGLVQFSLQPETDYRMTFEKQGWFGKSAEFTTKGMDPGIIDIARKVNLDFEQIVINKPVVVENLYYDYNKATIRQDAMPELDKIVMMMNDNPTLVIELSSHTDSQGGDKYNFNLSDQRAKKAAEYIVDNGVDIDRITGKGYGETKIINRCKNDVNCDDREHEQNRRTEFTVIKF